MITSIKLPADQLNKYITVVVIEFHENPEFIKNLAAQNLEGGFSLTPDNILEPASKNNSIPKTRGGTIPAYTIMNSETTFKWEIYIDEPGLKTIDISYSYQGKSTSNFITVKAAATGLNHNITNSGETVGEPQSNWIIDNFRSDRIGSIYFPEKGIYDIEMAIKPVKNEEIKFQWLWVK